MQLDGGPGVEYNFGDFDGCEVRMGKADAVGSNRKPNVHTEALVVSFKRQPRTRSNRIQLHPHPGNRAPFASVGCLGADADP